MTDETVQPEVIAPVVNPIATVETAPEAPTQEVAEAVADVADESFFQRVEKAVEELGASAHNLVDWLRQEIAKVRS
jgi:hypothetical protein